MSEGYQFQVNVWQPSPDTKPAIERHVVHGRVVELGPNWVAEQLSRIAEPSIANARSEGKTAMALHGLCRKHDLHPPPQADSNAPVEDGRQPVKARARNRRTPIEIAACWQHIGFDACYGEHKEQYDLSRCRGVCYLLGIDQQKPTSHGTRRPACMIGAVAAYLDRYPTEISLVRRWCEEYKLHCCVKGERASLETVNGLYQRIARRNSTEGKEKTRVFFNTFMALKAYCKGHNEIAFSDPPESVAVLVDPVKVP